MKYVNSLKYMNGFETATEKKDVSLRRVSDLCSKLGRVNMGTNSIFVPSGSAGHATAVMLESVIKHAGYKVGRISSDYASDSRKIVSLDGEYAPIEEYNRAVAELKSTVINDPDEEYMREEVTFALALLLCKMHAAEYIIIEAPISGDCRLASLCAPYDLVIVPTVYDGDSSVVAVCDAIRHGVREVVSGNQKKAIYDMISSACVANGARLTLTSKTSFKTEKCSSIAISFSYGDRSGYTLKSPSLIQRECAMLVIESALAIRRDGVKMPWASITSGLSSAANTGCFETLSVSPLLMLDTACTENEIKQLLLTLDEVFGVGRVKSIALCIQSGNEHLAELFGDIGVSSLIVVGEMKISDDNTETVVCKNCKEAAKTVVGVMKNNVDTICLGSLRFESELREEIVKVINY